MMINVLSQLFLNFNIFENTPKLNTQKPIDITEIDRI